MQVQVDLSKTTTHSKTPNLEEKLVIGIEVQRLFRPKKHGMEIAALEIIRQLQQRDLRNQYTIFAKKDEDEACIRTTSNFSIETGSTEAYPVWEQYYLPKAVKRLKPDILHCTANTAPLFCDRPLIITIHDVMYLESVNFGGSSYQNFGNLYRRFIVPKVAKKAAIIITVSEYEKRIIVDRLKMPEEKVRVVYNGVNAKFKPITDESLLQAFKDKYQLPDRFLLHFGNTAPNKNTIGVLKAYKIYHQYSRQPLPLVLTDCTRAHISGLLEKINAPWLINHIRVLEYIPFISIPCLYNLATVFLHPSHLESFGMPVIEAMACGVPVITSNTSALPEIAGGAACLIDPGNPADICDQLMRLLSDEDFYNDRRVKGFSNATRFTWKNAADQTLSIYNELVHGKRGE